MDVSVKNQLHVRTVECLLSWCYVSTESFRTAYCRAPNLRAHQEHTMALLMTVIRWNVEYSSTASSCRFQSSN